MPRDFLVSLLRDPQWALNHISNWSLFALLALVVVAAVLLRANTDAPRGDRW